jgi:hypothetical protein
MTLACEVQPDTDEGGGMFRKFFENDIARGVIYLWRTPQTGTP